MIFGSNSLTNPDGSIVVFGVGIVFYQLNFIAFYNLYDIQYENILTSNVQILALYGFNLYEFLLKYCKFLYNDLITVLL